jgi:hypothetical protein
MSTEASHLMIVPDKFLTEYIKNMAVLQDIFASGRGSAGTALVQLVVLLERLQLDFGRKRIGKSQSREICGERSIRYRPEMSLDQVV